MTDQESKRCLNGEGVCRRSFLKAGVAALAGVAASKVAFNNSAVLPNLSSEVHAAIPGTFQSCRIIVFGSDSLRDDYARALHAEGAPGLNRLLGSPGVTGSRNVICSLSDGVSVTQSGWAEIWSGLPAYWNKSYNNKQFYRMPDGTHLVDKIAYMDAKRTAGVDVYIGWVTGKHNISGGHTQTPHYIVNAAINGRHLPGTYYSDLERTNDEVSNLASAVLSEALTYNNQLCFLHFRDPDQTGHDLTNAGATNPHSSYLDKAMEIDQRISDLMDLLPTSSIPFKLDNGIYAPNAAYNPLSSDFVHIIYCSDHGFNFKAEGNWMGHYFEGDWTDHHTFSPRGMLAVNFDTIPTESTQQMSIGRLIYALTGGNPDVTITRGTAQARYQIGGESLLEGAA